MERRRFLRTAGLGIAATGLGLVARWPGFLVRAFGDEGTPAAAGPQERTVELAQAIARARRGGKPLLLLVVPADAGVAWERGSALGALINHGGTGVLDDMLVCELACATLAEAQAALPLDVKVEPSMLLVELDAEGGEFLPTRSIALSAAPRMGRGATEEDEAVSRARIAKGAAALHEAVSPDAAALARRAERNRAAFTEADHAALSGVLSGRGPVDVALARRGAAVLLVAAAGAAAEPKARARAALDLAGQAIVRDRPPGAQWARSAGCGEDIEGEPALGRDCGMGSVPLLSQRFLHFYTKR